MAGIEQFRAGGYGQIMEVLSAKVKSLKSFCRHSGPKKECALGKLTWHLCVK